VALAHGTGALTKASRLTQIQVALLTIETTALVQAQNGEQHHPVAMVWAQLPHGAIHSTQSALAQDYAAKFQKIKTTLLIGVVFISPPNNAPLSN
jgi:hypothetical protein